MLLNSYNWGTVSVSFEFPSLKTDFCICLLFTKVNKHYQLKSIQHWRVLNFTAYMITEQKVSSCLHHCTLFSCTIKQTSVYRTATTTICYRTVNKHVSNMLCHCWQNNSTTPSLTMTSMLKHAGTVVLYLIKQPLSVFQQQRIITLWNLLKDY